MFSKGQKKIICKQNKETYKIEIIGADYESGKDMEIIMDFIKKLSLGKKIFITTLGNIKTLDTNAIISLKKNPAYGTPTTIELEITPDKINAIEPLFHNIYSNIYIFEQSMSWSDFLEIRRVSSYFKIGELTACIHLHDLDSTWINLSKNQNIYMEELFYQLQIEQYSIKRKDI